VRVSPNRRSVTSRIALSWALAALVAAGCGTNYDDNPQPTDLSISGADLRRGALLWDSWWTVIGAPAPTDTFGLYTKTRGTQSGATTWRCQECHGWDYRGSQGAYATGPHVTGVAGVLDRVASRTNQELYDVLKNGTPPASGGSALTGTDHAFDVQLDNDEILALVRFLREGLVDTREVVADDGRATGNAREGAPLYAAANSDPNVPVGQCGLCHGDDGKALDMGDGSTPVFVGTAARSEPWRTLHQIRWGVPGTSMTSAIERGITALADQGDLLAYTQTLPAD